MKPKSRSRRRFDLAEHRAAAGGEDGGRKLFDQLGEGSFFPVAEDRLAPSVKIAAIDRPARASISRSASRKRPAQPPGQDPADGRLAGPTIADQRQTATRAAAWGAGIVCHSGRKGVSLCFRASTITSMGASCPV